MSVGQTRLTLPRVDEHWRQVLAQTRFELPALPLLGAGIVASLLPREWTGQTPTSTFTLLAGLIGLHWALLFGWRRNRSGLATWLEKLLPLLTAVLVTITIVGGLQRYPLQWVLVYLYVPVVAAVWTRSAWGVATFLFPGALTLAIELFAQVSGTPLPAMLANLLLPPTLYLALSSDEERVRRLRAQAEKLQEDAMRAECDARRVALAREVHDGLGGHLCAITTHAAVAALAAGTDRPRALSSASRLKARAASAAAELETLLYPTPTLSWADCATRLERIVEALKTPTLAISLTVVPAATTEQPPIAGDVAHAVERIAREALANALRHSAATQVAVRLEHRGRALRLTVEDDGQGIGDAPAGFGTESIASRAEALGGHARWIQNGGKGTELVVVAPLPEPR